MPRIYPNGKSVSKWVAKSSHELAAKKLGQVANWSKTQIDSTWKQLRSKVGQRGIMKPKIVSKPWGREEVLITSPNYVMKKIVIESGKRLSLQYHEEKEETVFVHKGILIVWKSEDFYDMVTLCPGEVYHVHPGDVHRFGCPENIDECVLIECSTTQLDDVVRLADDYNRK